MDVTSARSVNHTRVKVGCDIGHLSLGHLDLGDFGVVRTAHVLHQFHTIFIVKRDTRDDDIGTRLPALPASAVAVSTRGIVEGKAAVHRVGWIDLETAAGTPAAAATTATAAWRLRVQQGRTGQQDDYRCESSMSGSRFHSIPG